MHKLIHCIGWVSDKYINLPSCQPIIGTCLYPLKDSQHFLLTFYFSLLDCQQPYNWAFLFPSVDQEHISAWRGRYLTYPSTPALPFHYFNYHGLCIESLHRFIGMPKFRNFGTQVNHFQYLGLTSNSDIVAWKCFLHFLLYLHHINQKELCG